MGDDSIIGILFFAAIAVFLAHRLWQVLGRRDGDAPPAMPDKLRPREVTAPVDRMVPPAQKPIVFRPGDPMSLETSLRQIKTADPSFDERQFLGGAKAAFEMIVTAFARGERETLRPLLGQDVFRSFEQAIESREAQGQTLEMTVARISNSIDSARMVGDLARVTVAFRSGQTSVLRGSDGTVLEGDPRQVDDVIDIWTFARDTKSRDPNWTLVETRHQA